MSHALDAIDDYNHCGKCCRKLLLVPHMVKQQPMCMPAARMLKCMSAARVSKCMLPARVSKFMSAAKVLKCMSAARVSKCMSAARLSKCVSAARAAHCMSPAQVSEAHVSVCRNCTAQALLTLLNAGRLLWFVLQILCSFGVDTLEALSGTCTLFVNAKEDRWDVLIVLTTIMACYHRQ